MGKLETSACSTDIDSKEFVSLLLDMVELDSEMSDDDQWEADEAADSPDNVHLGATSPPEDPEQLYYQHGRAWRRYRRSIGNLFHANQASLSP